MNPDFTDAEKKVLLGLVEHPTLNDRELSEAIKVKPSTTTAVRRRLRERGVFRTVRIPMGNRLGYEIIVVAYGKIKPTMEKKETNAFLKMIKTIPYVFLSLASTDAFVYVAHLKNYTMFRQYADSTSEKFKDSDLVDPETWVTVVFSFDACRLMTFFDYGAAVRHAFGVKEKVKLDLEIDKPTEEKLTKKEKSVLRGLVLYPESSDKKIAEKIGASRQAVSSMKRRFEDLGLLRTVRVVDLQSLGYSLLGLAHSTFTPHATIKVRRNGIKFVQETIPSVLSVTSNPENVLLAPTLDYDEFHKLRTGTLSLYMSRGYLREEPRLILFPLSDTQVIKDFDFSGFMDVVVGEDG